MFESLADGHMILGCSDLTGRNWSGSLWYYRNPEEPPIVEKALTGIELDQSVVNGMFVANNRVSVKLCSIQTGPKMPQVYYYTLHGSRHA